MGGTSLARYVDTANSSPLGEFFSGQAGCCHMLRNLSFRRDTAAIIT